jgi:hypothetical protein
MKYLEIIPLTARVIDKHIEIWWDTKWQPIRYYQGKSQPSIRIQKECIRSFALNTGLGPDQKYEIKRWRTPNE